ncbi:hypothetical protein L1889_03720 [Paenalcaligenes niemegkensis]|uniref:hypothetical protein n=1 Tax=Paenalcaligenes niemegkensis TaxID=2895469 RepID=UPI001EE8DD15|nr:hypothetical protein [Paenalcaligenes niemegkensis]MCQ9615918.1 hypothetical protein [Paenalcaligenes niemegkensis]
MDNPERDVKDPYSIDLDTLNRVATNATSRATAKLSKLNLPNAIPLPEQIPLLGDRISKNYIRQTTAINEEYADQAPYLYAYTLKRYWHAAWKGAYWMDEARIARTVEDTEHTRKLSTAEGYIELEGGAWILFNDLGEINSTIGEILLDEAPIVPPPTIKQSSKLLHVIA